MRSLWRSGRRASFSQREISYIFMGLILPLGISDTPILPVCASGSSLVGLLSFKYRDLSFPILQGVQTSSARAV